MKSVLGCIGRGLLFTDSTFYLTSLKIIPKSKQKASNLKPFLSRIGIIKMNLGGAYDCYKMNTQEIIQFIANAEKKTSVK